jgi:hypothetical protein|tara:strand:- start:13953 stop:14648 length:696 start_codon:yes stop_codon:yes gene_type:complete
MSYAYALWSGLLLAIWLLVFAGLTSSAGRRQMLVTSALTAALGLTEPLFVPEYWNPPTLFDLAQRTGFDLESLIFAFAAGGLAGSLYEWLFPVRHRSVPDAERLGRGHRWHGLALVSPAVVFLPLYLVDMLNPIYAVIVALALGGTFTAWCRPDLLPKMLTGSVLFGALYFLFFVSLVWVHPAYVEQVWNLAGLSGVLLLGVPLEEVLFALGLGFLWSGAYEHLLWSRAAR